MIPIVPSSLRIRPVPRPNHFSSSIAVASPHTRSRRARPSRTRTHTMSAFTLVARTPATPAIPSYDAHQRCLARPCCFLLRHREASPTSARHAHQRRTLHPPTTRTRHLARHAPTHARPRPTTPATQQLPRQALLLPPTTPTRHSPLDVSSGACQAFLRHPIPSKSINVLQGIFHLVFIQHVSFSSCCRRYSSQSVGPKLFQSSPITTNHPPITSKIRGQSFSNHL